MDAIQSDPVHLNRFPRSSTTCRAHPAVAAVVEAETGTAEEKEVEDHDTTRTKENMTQENESNPGIWTTSRMYTVTFLMHTK